MKMVGFCRFSMLGISDWRTRQGRSDLGQIAKDSARILYEPERMERRFDTFEKLFLKSMRAQTDQDFTMAVMSSNAMPAKYRQRLADLCATVPRIRLFYFDPVQVVAAQRQVIDSLGHDWRDVLQFRLDDDDCVFSSYIERTRRYAAMLRDVPAFGISYPNVLISISYDGEAPSIYLRNAPFIACGMALRHPRRSAFSWIQHKHIPRHVVAVTDPEYYCILTHRADNDRERYEPEGRHRHQLKPVDEKRLNRIVEQQFAYLDDDGRRLLGLAVAR